MTLQLFQLIYHKHHILEQPLYPSPEIQVFFVSNCLQAIHDPDRSNYAWCQQLHHVISSICRVRRVDIWIIFIIFATTNNFN